ncbi:MAG: hypothetical protein RLZZ305_1494 [Actinomycetota bacterium]|jgi:hypothetical protein
MVIDAEPAHPHRSHLDNLVGFCSVGAGLVHGVAAGIHAEHQSTARAFVLLALLQTGAGLMVLLSPARRWSRAGAGGVATLALAGWLLTRTIGIGFVDGLATPESPQTADTLAAVLAVVALGGALRALTARRPGVAAPQPAVMAFVAAVLTGPALVAGASHVHHHDDAPSVSAFEISADGVIVATTVPSAFTGTTDAPTSTTGPDGGTSGAGTPADPAVPRTTTARPAAPVITVPTTAAATSTVAPATHSHSTTPEQKLAAQSGWPRVFDPSDGPDFEGVAGVTEVQFQRARAIISSTATDLAVYASTSTATAAGYRSIGDGATGYEHYIKWDLIQDGRVLDSKAPESLVYKVTAAGRTLVSAMYIAPPGTAINDPTLVEYAGPLMQWHIHDNLCFLLGRVVGLTTPEGNCLIGAKNEVQSPMVHVWIAGHPCGPFAAVEGVAAGTAQASNEERLDLCNRH